MELIDRQQAIDVLREYLINKRVPEDGTLTARLIENEVINKLPTAEPQERKTGRWIETEGLEEEIRCTMCTNPMRSDRGCDGSCQYDEKLYKQIMSIIEDRIDGGRHDRNFG